MDQPEETLLEEGSQVETEAPEEVVQEPRLVNIRYNGNTYEVPEHLADAWHQREQDFLRRLSEPTRRERQQQAQATPLPAPQEDPQDEDLRFYAGPSKALKEREERLQRQLEVKLQETLDLRERQAAWWGRFWSSNEDLRNKVDAVSFVVQRNWQQLAELDEEGAHREVSRLTRELLGMPNQRPGRTLSNRQVHDEPSSHPSRTTRRPQNPQAPAQYSAVEFLQKRAEDRRKARLNLDKEHK